MKRVGMKRFGFLVLFTLLILVVGGLAENDVRFLETGSRLLGSMVGQPFTLLCPDGQAALGIQASVDRSGFIDALGLFCQDQSNVIIGNEELVLRDSGCAGRFMNGLSAIAATKNGVEGIVSVAAVCGETPSVPIQSTLPQAYTEHKFTCDLRTQSIQVRGISGFYDSRTHMVKGLYVLYTADENVFRNGALLCRADPSVPADSAGEEGFNNGARVNPDGTIDVLLDPSDESTSAPAPATDEMYARNDVPAGATATDANSGSDLTYTIELVPDEPSSPTSAPAVHPVAAAAGDGAVDEETGGLAEPTEEEIPVEDCTNNADDNEDGSVDCEDYACREDDYCKAIYRQLNSGLFSDSDEGSSSQDGVEDCTNGVDDNGDGGVDCDDYACGGYYYCKAIYREMIQDIYTEETIAATSSETEAYLADICDPDDQECVDDWLAKNANPLEEDMSQYSGSSIAGPSSVLHIGDSHSVGAYGKELHRLLIQKNVAAQTYACGGAAASNFDKVNYKVCNEKRDSGGKPTGPNPAGSLVLVGSQTPSNLIQTPFNFENQLSAFNPEMVIISLGTNFLTAQGVNNQAANINSLVEKVVSSGKKCVWVGAPASTNRKVDTLGINRALKVLVESRCRFIDANTLTDAVQYTGGDGIHYTGQGGLGGKLWARAIYALLYQEYLTPPADDEPFDPSSEGYGSVKPRGESAPETTKAISEMYSESVKNIDKAWRRVSPFILAGEYVYQTGVGFVPWAVLYPAPVVASVADEDDGPKPIFDIPEDNVEKYDTWFKKYGEEHNVPPSLLKAVTSKESGFSTRAVSTAGAVGLAQFTYKTAKSYFGANQVVMCCGNLEPNEKETRQGCMNEVARWGRVWKEGTYMCTPQNDARFNPELSIQAQAKLFANLLQNYQGAALEDQIKLAILAYHDGPGAVNGYIRIAQGQKTWSAVKSAMNVRVRTYKGKQIGNGDYMELVYVGPIYARYAAWKNQFD
ncbi:transglycosylase SLT domain-containing protein [Candidatus Woesearchaeota archaeon]|nr:transglycosylase SLT domain-containing protein [Candidatus Woesearchaeota archaeon]